MDRLKGLATQSRNYVCGSRSQTTPDSPEPASKPADDLEAIKKSIRETQLLLDDVNKDLRNLDAMAAGFREPGFKIPHDIGKSIQEAKGRRSYLERLLSSFGAERRRLEEELRKMGRRPS